MIRRLGQRPLGKGRGDGCPGRVGRRWGIVAMRGHGEVGASGLLVLAGVLLVALVAGASALVVGAARSHARVDAAADLVAVGAAGQLLVDPDPCAGAAELAAANQVALSSCTVTGAAVTVTVSAPLPPGVRWAVPAATSSARAELVPDTDSES